MRVSGLDEYLDKLKGGLDGLYVLADCHLGHPLYRREGSLTGGLRTLLRCFLLGCLCWQALCPESV